MIKWCTKPFLLHLDQNVPKHWKLGKLLGTGAFGQVFLCHDTENGREMAVKQIETGITTSAQQKVRFILYLAHCSVTPVYQKTCTCCASIIRYTNAAVETTWAGGGPLLIWVSTRLFAFGSISETRSASYMITRSRYVIIRYYTMLTNCRKWRIALGCLHFRTILLNESKTLGTLNNG